MVRVQSHNLITRVFLIGALLLLLCAGVTVLYYQEDRAENTQTELAVVAVNTNKDAYEVHEPVHLTFSVLDLQGRVVCAAAMQLTITTPRGTKAIISTADGTIVPSEACYIYGVTASPDFEVSYVPNEEGIYQAELSATVGKSRQVQTITFRAGNTSSIQVERKGPTRIYPRAVYNMSLLISSTEGYRGPVTERVPYTFKIVPQAGLSITEQGESSVLTWEISLPANQTKELAYQFDAPDKNPAFYQMGPVQVGSYKEGRQWQIASDDIATSNFTFTIGTETWVAFTQSCSAGTIIAAHTLGDGNVTLGALNTSYSKASGGSTSCQNVWSWSGTWEDLGVPSGSTVTGIAGDYDYEIEKSSVTGAETGPLVLTSASGALRATLLAAASASSAVAWTVRQGTEQVFAGEPSSTQIKLNLTGSVTSSGGGTRLWELHDDNVRLRISYTPPPDTTAPNVSILVPVAGANISGVFLVNASINDSSTVQKVNATLHNNTGNATGLILMSRGSGQISAGHWNATINTIGLRDGYYNLTVNATDDGGNINLTNRSIVIDNTPVNASAAGLLLNGTNMSNQIIQINASVNDSLSKVFNVTFRLANASGSATDWLYATRLSGDISQGVWNTSFNSSLLVNGYYNVTINATDFAGNQLFTNISSFNVSNVLNASPVIKSIVMGESITLLPGSFLFVTCNATIEDDDGYDNIETLNATFYDASVGFDAPDDNNDHYTNDSCAFTNGGSTQLNVTCGFSIAYYANNASWACNVTAYDKYGKLNASANQTLVNELLAVGTNTDTLDYGNLSVTDTSSEQVLNITNQGNVGVNVSVRGFGWDDPVVGDGLAMMCESGNISIGYHRYSNMSGAVFEEMINLTSTHTTLKNFTLLPRINDNAPQFGRDMNLTYWRIRLPTGIGGLCNGTVELLASVGI